MKTELLYVLLTFLKVPINPLNRLKKRRLECYSAYIVFRRRLTQAFSLILALQDFQQTLVVTQHKLGSLYSAIGESVQTKIYFSIKNQKYIVNKNEKL